MTACIFCQDWTDRSNCGHVLLGTTLLPAKYATRSWVMAGEIGSRAADNLDAENRRDGAEHIERQFQRAGWRS